MISIKHVTEQDKEFWLSIDDHACESAFSTKVFGKLGYVISVNGVPIGILHYNLVWDKLPFLNLIKIKPEFRNLGYGTTVIQYWEKEMLKQKFKMVLLSTQVNEQAQFLYRRIGYQECGCLALNNCPLEQPMEMFFYKIL